MTTLTADELARALKALALLHVEQPTVTGDFGGTGSGPHLEAGTWEITDSQNTPKTYYLDSRVVGGVLHIRTGTATSAGGAVGDHLPLQFARADYTWKKAATQFSPSTNVTTTTDNEFKAYLCARLGLGTGDKVEVRRDSATHITGSPATFVLTC